MDVFLRGEVASLGGRDLSAFALVPDLYRLHGVRVVCSFSIGSAVVTSFLTPPRVCANMIPLLTT